MGLLFSLIHSFLDRNSDSAVGVLTMTLSCAFVHSLIYVVPKFIDPSIHSSNSLPFPAHPSQVPTQMRTMKIIFNTPPIIPPSFPPSPSLPFLPPSAIKAQTIPPTLSLHDLEILRTEPERLQDGIPQILQLAHHLADLTLLGGLDLRR